MITFSSTLVVATLLLTFSCLVVESSRVLPYDTTARTVSNAHHYGGRDATHDHVMGGRIWRKQCPEANIQVGQGLLSTSGIPTFRVSIANLCNSNCTVAKVHVHCGWFASARLVSPRLFKRLRYDDCVVNGGKPIPYGHVIEFQYANTRSYPLSLASYVCSSP